MRYKEVSTENAHTQGTQRMQSPDDPVYRAVLAAREPGAIAAELTRAWASWDDEPPPLSLEVEVLQTHYRPFDCARLVADALIGLARKKGKQVHQYLYLQIYPSAALAHERAAAGSKKCFLKCYVPAMFVADSLNALVWALPNGPRLRPAKVFLRRKQFKKFLRMHRLVPPSLATTALCPALVRYVPRRRAVFRYEYAESGRRRCFYVKLYRPGEDVHAARHLQLMETATAGGSLGFSTPRLMLHDQRRRAIVLDEIPGVSFTSLLTRSDSEGIVHVGRALAGLHRARIPLANRWRASDELLALRAAMRDVGVALPQLGGRIDRTIQRLQRDAHDLDSRETTPIHANLFGDQILLDHGRVGIVDWDDLCMGDPIFDVGRLLAHVIFVAKYQRCKALTMARCVDALLGAYESESGRPIPRARSYCCNFAFTPSRIRMDCPIFPISPR